MENKLKFNFRLPKSLPGKSQWLIILLCGILLVIIVFPTSGKKDEEKVNNASSAEYNYNESYESGIEARLAETLSDVQGVGKVKVMVTLKSSSEKVVEKDTETDSQTVEEKDKEGGSRVTKDSSFGETTIYDNQSGAAGTPYVSKELSPTIEGVIVIAEGGENAVVVQEITEAIQALFNIDTHKIKIMKMNQSE